MKTKSTLLYIDDEEINIFIFERTFSMYYNIITSLSGEKALKILDDNKIDIVISDMRMPKMNGLEFITDARIKFPNIGYFILTGFDFNVEIELALKNKIIEECFKKPYNVELINKTLNLKSSNS